MSTQPAASCPTEPQLPDGSDLAVLAVQAPAKAGFSAQGDRLVTECRAVVVAAAGRVHEDIGAAQARS